MDWEPEFGPALGSSETGFSVDIGQSPAQSAASGWSISKPAFRVSLDIAEPRSQPIQPLAPSTTSASASFRVSLDEPDVPDDFATGFLIPQQRKEPVKASLQGAEDISANQNHFTEDISATENLISATSCPAKKPRTDGFRLASEREEEASEAAQPPKAAEAESASFKVTEDIGSQAKDGKLTCLKCHTRIEKSNFKNHARRRHVGKPYKCLECPVETGTEEEMTLHQLVEHGVETSGETFALRDLSAAIDREARECFGGADEVDYARLRCKPCRKFINKMQAKQHIAAKHFRRPMRRCRLCPFVSEDFSAAITNKHVAKPIEVHGARPGPDTIHSEVATHVQAIKEMVVDLLEKP